ncbi:MAG: hypothetical protein M3O46_19840 [Myxococcota bacterium]|nr:hypothetical protein [Myxococcota bacterium]
MGAAVKSGMCRAAGCNREAVETSGAPGEQTCGALVCKLRVRWQEHAAAERIDETEANLARAHAHLLEISRRFAAADARPRAYAGDGSPLSEGERERRVVQLMSAASAFAEAEVAFERRKGVP